MHCQSHSSHNPSGFLDESSKGLTKPKATSYPACFKDHTLGLYRGKAENATLVRVYFVCDTIYNSKCFFFCCLPSILSIQKSTYKI